MNNSIYNTIEIAAAYIKKGYAAIPVYAQSKQPFHSEWQTLKLTEDNLRSYFTYPNLNVGVVLGKASNGLIDIDLDDPIALKYADHFLPQTNSVFGRDGNPSSHRLYLVPDPAPRKFFASGRGKNAMIIELRSNGNFTVFPGSVHESGEVVRFEKNGEPRQTTWAVLEGSARKVALATVLHKVWNKGIRHSLALAVAGFLVCRKWSQEDVNQLITCMTAETMDDDLQDRLSCVETTFSAFANGQSVAYKDTLVQHLGEAIYAAICSWFPDAPNVVKNFPNPTNPPQFDQFTDAGIADEFSRVYKNTLICTENGKKWYHRKNQVYEKIDHVKVQGLATTFLQGKVADLGFFAKQNLNRNKINATIELSRSKLWVDHLRFDTSPNLIGLSDGSVFDLSMNQTVSGTEAIISKKIGVPYDPATDCPTWKRFLEEVFEHDQSIIDYVQKAVGYSLTGSVQERVCFVLIGKGANGKSTFLKTLQSLFGDYAGTIPMQTLMEQKNGSAQTNDLASLVGKRLVVASEGERDSKLAEAKIKLMTGGDKISCRYLYGEFFEYNPCFKLWLATNNFPSVSGSDKAIWDRLRIINFPVSFDGAKQDKTLGEKLLKELPGIFNWALAGYEIWKESGLVTPEKITAITNEYRQENDPFGYWLSACCTTEDQKAKTSMKDLHDSYLKWSINSGVEPLSMAAMGKELSRLGIKAKRLRHGIVRIGIALQEEDIHLPSRNSLMDGWEV
jgi:putative DNA primase/helicase